MDIIDYKKLAYDKQVADYIGVTPAEVRRLRKQGKLIDLIAERAMIEQRMKEGRY